MRLYEGDIKEYSDLVINNKLADRLHDSYFDHYKHKESEGEYRSWNVSLNFLNNIFSLAELEENKLIIEYELPYSSKRIDAVVFGSNKEETGGIVIIELKQWSNESVLEASSEGNVIADYRRFKKEQAHPSIQVQGYNFGIKDFLTFFSEKNAPNLSSCVYCHNYSRFGAPQTLFLPEFEIPLKEFPVFSKEDTKKFSTFLSERLGASDGEETYLAFTNSPVKPSKKLLDHTNDMIHKQQIFNLIDDQIAAYNNIIHRAKELSKTKEKSVVIVKGGPGTGKSVIALEVMGELMRKGKTVFHATGAKAFTETLRYIVGPRAKNLFKFFNGFTTSEPNSIDVLICDEAHRIRETSNNRFTRSARRSYKPQIQELIDVSKLSLFFIDENQVVRPNEVGSIELIRSTALDMGVKPENISEFELLTQFRCSGSDAYLQWLDDALDITPSEFAHFDTKMKFKIFDSPHEMMEKIREHNKEKPNSARITAGFCWKWSNPLPDGSLVNDVKIGEFEMPWERKNSFWKWATDDSGMEQVGTVYTSQGFEFDYIAVIFGNDLKWDTSSNTWIAQPKNSHDSMVTRGNQDIVRHFKNVYRTLMSRAHKGVYVYFMDEETKKYFTNKSQNVPY